MLSIFLISVVWQDLKQRAIHIALPILVFITALIINFLSDHLDYIMCLKNIGFVLVNIFGLVLYFSLKNKSIVNPIDSMIGLGDVLFFLALTPLFNIKSYILFFIAGMVFSLILHVITKTFKKQKTVPLAGYLALFLIGIVFVERILNLNLL
ncbi:prepilin peptidase [Psychroserpens algicola]|uniref:prepilin peptidase n=1 Tax=Psychroserpens algicola TaxID=1719034 RepID=UPI003B8489F0